MNIIEANSNEKSDKKKIIPRGKLYPRRKKYKKNNTIIKTITRQVGFAETL
jgi:hypothetical protein